MPNQLSQSNVIFFCLFLAFIVFITLRGELPKYLDVLFTTQSSGSSSGGSGGSSSGASGVLGAIDSATGSDVLGRAATGLRNMLPNLGSFFGGGGAVAGLGNLF